MDNKVIKKVDNKSYIEVIYNKDNERYRVANDISAENFCKYQVATPNFMVTIANHIRNAVVFIGDLTIVCPKNGGPNI